ncbi:pyruvate kinase [Agathobaculum sp.]|uniref:pyruvate kinase n=1 Tax=Agathobaculum sp. TaxID=2048138 RepID=UPI0027BA2B93|nr:pyruvate kinase [Agathobaculum sp.]
MRKTKIICTLGPATDPVLPEIIKAGMNVARLNFSHGSHEEHKVRMDAVKAARRKLGMPVGIMLDTKGPEIRTKTYKDGKIEIVEGQEFILTTREVEGDENIVSITYDGLPGDVKVGTRILIDDGLVAFEVTEIRDGTDIVCKALNGGPLSNRKSINVPGISLNMPFVSERDRADIEFGLSQGIDFIAASFTRTAQDVRDIKAILKEHGQEDVEIIAKIENMEGVRNIQEILDEANGVMVARGDLGVEVPFEELPEIQKSIIKICISRGKRVVTATQMLESMAKNPRPTRAEVSDVANAVYDGTSAIMLSGETSVGKYPVETVQTMSRIANNAESTIHYDRRRATRLEFQNMNVAGDLKTLAISHATCSTTADLGAKCIVAFTEAGSTARAVSTYRPGAPIIAATPNEKTCNRLTMSWGVTPVLVSRHPKSGTELYDLSEQAAISALDLRVGDIITITAGMPVGHVNYTNTLRVHQLTERSFAHIVQD